MSSIQIVEDTFGFVPDPENPKDSSRATKVRRFTLTNKSGTQIQVINHGARITSIKVPDRDGKIDDVVLGFETINGYLGNYLFGGTVGRVASRTAKGKFTLEGKLHQLSINNRENHLHGGNSGFDKKLWEAHVQGVKLTFSCLSKDGEEGYPGDVLANVTYELTPDSQLIISYTATVTKATPICLTNHSYFNLSGHQNADKELKGHHIMLNADNYTPLNENLIPTGEITPVDGTIFDLRANKNLHDLLKQFPQGPNGFDNNFCINRREGEIVRLVGIAQDTGSGRVMVVYSDQPGVQFYTANYLPEKDSAPLQRKEGARYYKHGAFCLETQNYPDAINHANFPNAVVTPGNVYTHKLNFKFFTTA